MSKKVTLQTWADANFAKLPHKNTLRAWARDCKIFPIPEKVGRDWLVEPSARYVGNDLSKVAEHVTQAA